MSEQYTKAQFWKCALQVNPPSYLAYRGQEQSLSEDEYNQQLLQVCREENIKVLALLITVMWMGLMRFVPFWLQREYLSSLVFRLLPVKRFILSVYFQKKLRQRN